jgi:hypothetical protein
LPHTVATVRMCPECVIPPRLHSSNCWATSSAGRFPPCPYCDNRHRPLSAAAEMPTSAKPSAPVRPTDLAAKRRCHGLLHLEKRREKVNIPFSLQRLPYRREFPFNVPKVSVSTYMSSPALLCFQHKFFSHHERLSSSRPSLGIGAEYPMPKPRD